MSAIVGIYHERNEPIRSEWFAPVMNALRKYPADNIQTWDKNNVFLGCLAQWITPESVGERLPYYDPERRLAITSDAILDNREELFEALSVSYGMRSGMPDSQLILLAYDKWGIDSPKHLHGDFAFLIWDEREERLFGARDFSGSRSLFYHMSPQRFACCTVLQPLLELPGVDRTLNEQWIADYLAIPNVIDSIDDSSTVYRDIRQLPPSHLLIVSGGKLSMRRYINVAEKVELLKLKSREEYEEAFLDVYSKAVSARLRTHKEVGVCLSGGLDSGSVASLAARALKSENKPLHSFSYVPIDEYEDWTPKYLIPDERQHIQATVRQVGNIRDNYLSFRERSPYSEIDRTLEMLEMPYKTFENSFWIDGVHEEARRRNVGILLTGARGNLGVSWGFALSYYGRQLRRLRWVRLVREMRLYCNNTGAGRRQFLEAVARKAYPRLDQWATARQASEAGFPVFIHPALAERTAVMRRLEEQGIDPAGGVVKQNAYEARRNHFGRTYPWNLSGIIGTKSSLTYQVWDRDPTNDFRVIRFCLSVPEEQYVHDGMDRALIRRATAGLLPDEVRLNQRSRGLQGADGIQRMAREWDCFTAEAEQLCKDRAMQEYIDVSVVRGAMEMIRGENRPVNQFDTNYCILMRSLILYRFLNKSALKGGDSSARSMAEAGAGSS